MTETGRRGFFKQLFATGAALAATGMVAGRPARAEAAETAETGKIKGVCLYVPSLGKAADFVEMMNRNAPGSWEVHALNGSLSDHYHGTKERFEAARGSANTFVGVVDPATFAVVHEAIVDCCGSFHYVTYQDRNRVVFSVQM